MKKEQKVQLLAYAINKEMTTRNADSGKKFSLALDEDEMQELLTILFNNCALEESALLNKIYTAYIRQGGSMSAIQS